MLLGSSSSPGTEVAQWGDVSRWQAGGHSCWWDSRRVQQQQRRVHVSLQTKWTVFQPTAGRPVWLVNTGGEDLTFLFSGMCCDSIRNDHVGDSCQVFSPVIPVYYNHEGTLISALQKPVYKKKSGNWPTGHFWHLKLSKMFHKYCVNSNYCMLQLKSKQWVCQHL